MNRFLALTIILEIWMLEESFLQYVDVLEIESTKTASERGEIAKIWIANYDESIFKIAKGEMQILKNLILYLDNGEEEILITEKNYKQYDYNKFYKIRTGKYDEELHEIF